MTPESLPNQALVGALSAILGGLAIAAGIVRVAKWNYRLGKGTAFAPHGERRA